MVREHRRIGEGIPTGKYDTRFIPEHVKGLGGMGISHGHGQGMRRGIVRRGFFMFGTNMGSTVAEVLAMYRRRVGMEQLISSLKRITGIKHICVWNQDFVDGAMILALLGEAAISVARHCMAVTRKVRTNYLGVEVIRVVKPSTESMVRSLSYSTLTRYRGERVR